VGSNPTAASLDSPAQAGLFRFSGGIWLALLAWVQIPPRPGLGQTDPPGFKPHGISIGFVGINSPYRCGYGFVLPPRHSSADAAFGPPADHQTQPTQPRFGGADSFLVGNRLASLAGVQIPPRPGLGQTDPPGFKPHGIPTGFVDFISPYHFGYGFVSPPRHSGADATFGPPADHQTQPTQPRFGGADSFLVGNRLASLAWVQIPPRPGLGQTDPPGFKPHGIPTGFVDFISPYHFGYGFVSPPRHSGADATFGPSADHQTQPTQPRFGGAVSLFGWDLARFARVGSNPVDEVDRIRTRTTWRSCAGLLGGTSLPAKETSRCDASRTLTDAC
jgi:hypothetical protein